jgi:hypothetical protein
MGFRAISGRGTSFLCVSISARRQEQDRQAPRALCAVNDYAFNIPGGRRPRHEHAIRAARQINLTIGIMHRLDNGLRIEQHNQMLRQHTQSVHDQLRLRQPVTRGVCHMG